jgi:hypothetical protein
MIVLFGRYKEDDEEEEEEEDGGRGEWEAARTICTSSRMPCGAEPASTLLQMKSTSVGSGSPMYSIIFLLIHGRIFFSISVLSICAQTRPVIHFTRHLSHSPTRRLQAAVPARCPACTGTAAPSAWGSCRWGSWCVCASPPHSCSPSPPPPFCSCPSLFCLYLSSDRIQNFNKKLLHSGVETRNASRSNIQRDILISEKINKYIQPSIHI